MLHCRTITIEAVRSAAKRNLALDEDGEMELNKKAQVSSQMVTCIQASIAHECA